MLPQLGHMTITRVRVIQPLFLYLCLDLCNLFVRLKRLHERYECDAVRILIAGPIKCSHRLFSPSIEVKYLFLISNPLQTTHKRNISLRLAIKLPRVWLFRLSLKSVHCKGETRTLVLLFFFPHFFPFALAAGKRSLPPP